MTPTEKTKIWRLKNPEKYKATQAAYRKKHAKKLSAYIGQWMADHPEKRIYTSVKSRAKKTNVVFNIEVSDIKIPDKCPILNIPIIKEFKGNGNSNKGPRSNSPSIDRIDNTKGYIKGNIQVISNRANVMKNSASPEQLLQFAFWVILTYGYLIDQKTS